MGDTTKTRIYKNLVPQLTVNFYAFFLECIILVDKPCSGDGTGGGVFKILYFHVFVIWLY